MPNVKAKKPLFPRNIPQRAYLNSVQKGQQLSNAIKNIIRNFSDIEAGIFQYWEIPNRFAVGDFLLHFEFLTTVGGQQIILGNEYDTSNFIAIDTGEKICISIAGAKLESADNVFELNKLVKGVIERVSGVVSVNLDGVPVATGVKNGTFALNRIAKDGNGTYYTGILANIFFKYGFDASPFYKIDQTWSGGSDVLIDSNGNANGIAVNITKDYSKAYAQQTNNNWLGTVNLWTDPASEIGSEWVYNYDNSYSFAGVSGERNDILNGFVGRVGDLVVTTFSIGNFSGTGALKIKHRTSNIGRFKENGHYREEYEVTGSTRMLFVRHSPGDTLSLNLLDITTKRLLKVGE